MCINVRKGDNTEKAFTFPVIPATFQMASTNLDISAIKNPPRVDISAIKWFKKFRGALELTQTAPN